MFLNIFPRRFSIWARSHSEGGRNMDAPTTFSFQTFDDPADLVTPSSIICWGSTMRV